jgi:tetratricopeptide (TPR) repeat protein
LLILLGLGVVVLAALIVAACIAGGVLVVHQLGGGAALAERARSWRPPRVPSLTRSVSLSRVANRNDDEATIEMASLGALPPDRNVYGRAPLPTRSELAERLQGSMDRVQRRVRSARAPRATDLEISPAVLGSEAAHCNTLGLALRRAGHPNEAATLHEAARLIYAGTGDRRSEALTANVLGVALAEDGRHDAALEQFEHARTVLQAIGDRQWEGKVLANIGLSKHRLGQDDQAVAFLQSALEALAPETEAYERVERRIERAG